MLSFIKFGPGGIRTHDQRIMSPLRYRCATGPNLWLIILNCHFTIIKSALPTSQKILNGSDFLRQSATGPNLWLIILNCHFTIIKSALPTSQRILNGSDFLRQSATGPL